MNNKVKFAYTDGFASVFTANVNNSPIPYNLSDIDPKTGLDHDVVLFIDDPALGKYIWTQGQIFNCNNQDTNTTYNFDRIGDDLHITDSYGNIKIISLTTNSIPTEKHKLIYFNGDDLVADYLMLTGAYVVDNDADFELVKEKLSTPFTISSIVNTWTPHVLWAYDDELGSLKPTIPKNGGSYGGEISQAFVAKNSEFNTPLNPDISHFAGESTWEAENVGTGFTTWAYYNAQTKTKTNLNSTLTYNQETKQLELSNSETTCPDGGDYSYIEQLANTATSTFFKSEPNQFGDLDIIISAGVIQEANQSSRTDALMICPIVYEDENTLYMLAVQMNNYRKETRFPYPFGWGDQTVGVTVLKFDKPFNIFAACGGAIYDGTKYNFESGAGYYKSAVKFDGIQNEPTFEVDSRNCDVIPIAWAKNDQETYPDSDKYYLGGTLITQEDGLKIVPFDESYDNYNVNNGSSIQVHIIKEQNSLRLAFSDVHDTNSSDVNIRINEDRPVIINFKDYKVSYIDLQGQVHIKDFSNNNLVKEAFDLFSSSNTGFALLSDSTPGGVFKIIKDQDSPIWKFPSNEEYRYNKDTESWELTNTKPLDIFTGSHLMHNSITNKLFYSDGSAVTNIACCGTGSSSGGGCDCQMSISSADNSIDIIPDNTVDYTGVSTSDDWYSQGHQITFKFSPLDEVTIEVGDGTLPIPPSGHDIPGYELLEWFPAIVPAYRDAVYEAQYNTDRWKVTFKNYDGTVLKSSYYDNGNLPVYKGKTPTHVPDSQYEYTFSGWDKKIDVVNNQDYVYTAQFSKVSKQYRVTFVDWDNSSIQTGSYDFGTNVTAPANPTRPNDSQNSYVFSGWSPSFNPYVTQDIIYKAIYTKTPIEDIPEPQYSFLKFYKDGNQGNIYIQCTYDESRATIFYRTTSENDWQVFTSGSKIAVSNYIEVSGKIYSDYPNIHFKPIATGSFTLMGVEGSIMSLQGQNPDATIIFHKGAFQGLFKDEHIFGSVILPATTLTQDCYRETFSGSSLFLTSEVILPATNIPTGAYVQMFKNNKRLSQATILATTASDDALTEMFSGCSRLNKLSVGFRTWGTFTDWVKGVETTEGDFTNSELQWIFDDSHIPTNWKRTVTFLNGGGSPIEIKQVLYNRNVIYTGQQPTPASTYGGGYKFLGWSPDISEPILQDTTFVPKFSYPTQYYNGNGWISVDIQNRTLEKGQIPIQARRVIIGYDVDNVADYALAERSLLQSCTIIAPVTLGNYVLYNSAISDVYGFDEYVLDIGAGCFQNCRNLTEIKWGLNKIPPFTFNNSTLQNFNDSNFSTIESIGFCAFKNSGLGGDLNIPDSVRFVDDQAFSGTQITSVGGFNNVDVLSARVFENCQQLTSVEVGCKYNFEDCLNNCPQLTSIKFQNIEDLYRYTSLNGINGINYELYLGPNLKQIRDSAIYTKTGSDDKTTIYYQGTPATWQNLLKADIIINGSQPILIFGNTSSASWHVRYDGVLI